MAEQQLYIYTVEDLNAELLFNETNRSPNPFGGTFTTDVAAEFGGGNLVTINDVTNDGTFDSLQGTQTYVSGSVPGETLSAGNDLTTDYFYTVTWTDPVTGVQQTGKIYNVFNNTTGQLIGVVSTFEILPGITYTATSDGAIGTAVGYDQLYVCFASGTLIETPQGERAVEDLSEGDLVITRDNGEQPVRWVGSRHFTAQELAAHPHLRPIRIRAGALGSGLPMTDLIVSPQHRVLVRSRIAQKMFGTDEVLVAAKQLCQIDGIDIAEDLEGVTYHHILFDRHEVVISNGAETESMYTGPEAIKSVGDAARREILEIFPELATRDYTPVAARPMPSGRMGRKLAVRHSQNAKPLLG